MKVRKLTFKDTYYMSQILSKMKLDVTVYEEQAKEIMKQARENNEEITQEKGKELMMPILVRAMNDVITNYHLAYNEIRDWMADLINVKPEEIEDMPLDTPYKIFHELAKENDLLAFFKQAGGSQK